MPADSIVMEFNPWLSLSDRSLVTAYFNSLANVVSENLDKDLFSPIQKYGEAIASLDGIGGWMEVLRLIRSTADFPGIVYIVAYDKGYLNGSKRKLPNTVLTNGYMSPHQIFTTD